MNDFRIVEICKAKGITQTDLAEQIGISRVGLSKAINGNTTISTLKKIANALDVEVTDLFEKVEGDFKCPNCGTALNISVELSKRKE